MWSETRCHGNEYMPEEAGLHRAPCEPLRCSRIPRPSFSSIVTAEIWTSCRSPATPVVAPLVRLSLNVSSLYPAVSLKRDRSRIGEAQHHLDCPQRVRAVHSLGMCLNRAVRAGHDPQRSSLDLLHKSYPRHSLLPPLHFETLHTTRLVCFSPRRHCFVR
jgi:hypothetical protein